MRLIGEKEAAVYLGLSETFLKKLRCQGIIDVYGIQPSDACNPEAKAWYDQDELDKYIQGDSDRQSGISNSHKERIR